MAAVSSPRTVALLGSTGSIGTQAIQIITANPDRFRVIAISAGGRDLDLVARQAVQLQVELVGIAAGQERDLATRIGCLLYTSPSPRDLSTSRMPSSA